MYVVFVNATATTEIYTYYHTLSLPDALPISSAPNAGLVFARPFGGAPPPGSYNRCPLAHKFRCGAQRIAGRAAGVRRARMAPGPPRPSIVHRRHRRTLLTLRLPADERLGGDEPPGHSSRITAFGPHDLARGKDSAREKKPT